MTDRMRGPVETPDPGEWRPAGFSRRQAAFSVACIVVIAALCGFLGGPVASLVFLLGLTLGLVFGAGAIAP